MLVRRSLNGGRDSYGTDVKIFPLWLENSRQCSQSLAWQLGLRFLVADGISALPRVKPFVFPRDRVESRNAFAWATP